MKTRILAIALIFISATAFMVPTRPLAGNSTGITAGKTAWPKRVWQNYCGYISAGCNGTMTVKIASDLNTAYLLELAINGVPISFSLVSIAPAVGSPGVFSLNVNYTCSGVWTNYTGGAYTWTCP